MKLNRVGVDLAKNVFQVHGIDRSEKPVCRRNSEYLPLARLC
jgi:transposase